MRGRHPKPPELRQRRNKTTTAATLPARPDQLAVATAPATTPGQPKRPARKATSGKRPTAVGRRRPHRPRTSPAATKAAQPKAAQPKAATAPALPTGYHWHPETIAWWADAWASPMAAQWLASDAHVLRRLAVLVNEFWHRPTPTVLAEIRQQQALLGLTPMDRHRLQWKIDMGREAGGSAPDESDAPPPPAKDPREALRLVK